jgi:hypothetical protein
MHYHININNYSIGYHHSSAPHKDGSIYWFRVQSPRHSIIVRYEMSKSKFVRVAIQNLPHMFNHDAASILGYINPLLCILRPFFMFARWVTKYFYAPNT